MAAKRQAAIDATTSISRRPPVGRGYDHEGEHHPDSDGSERETLVAVAGVELVGSERDGLGEEGPEVAAISVITASSATTWDVRASHRSGGDHHGVSGPERRSRNQRLNKGTKSAPHTGMARSNSKTSVTVGGSAS